MELTSPHADAGTMGDQATETASTPAVDEYSGLLGAFPYAFRRSQSTAFRLYAVASGLLGAFVAGLIVLTLVVWIANPVGLVGERAFLGVIAIFLFGPLFAPVLLVARRHRRGRGDPRYDRGLAVAGFVFVLTLWVGLVVSVPPGQQAEPTGLFAPVAAALYSLPQSASLLPPLFGAVGILVAHRLLR